MTTLKTIGKDSTPMSWTRQPVPEHESITAANHNLDLYYSNDIIGFAWSTHEKPITRQRDKQNLQQSLTKRIILFDSIYGTVPGLKAQRPKVKIFDPNAGESQTEKTARSFWQNTIRTAYESGASDIHIEPIPSHTGNDCHLIVSLRLDNQARFHARIPSDLAPSFARYAVESSGMDPTNRLKIQAARRRWTHPETGDTISLRIQGTPSGTNIIRIVIRLLDTTKLKAGIGDLKLDPDELQIWNRALALQSGLVIISGPTGSGKSTTLYAALLSIYNRNNQRIFATMEDPVEYDLPFRATQTPVHKHEGPSFAEYIEANMRNDGDTFLVGEIRDTITAAAALQLANTGHQVLTSIHANGAPETASRLIDLGVDKSILSDTLKMVVSQKLIPAPCPHCRKQLPTKESMPLLRAMGGELMVHGKNNEWQDKYQREPSWIIAPGCPICDFTGIKGRCVAQEFLIIDSENKIHLKEGNIPALRASMQAKKMPSMKEVAWRLAWQGKITIQQAGELTNQLEQN
jgi:type II secretory ATPase GspE/PulE/Tfp pilus assembly ATPase PilB-like protein